MLLSWSDLKRRCLERHFLRHESEAPGNLLLEYLLQTPPAYHPQATYPMWLVLHGAFARAEQALTMFGPRAAEHATFLLAPKPLVRAAMATAGLLLVTQR